MSINGHTPATTGADVRRLRALDGRSAHRSDSLSPFLPVAVSAFFRGRTAPDFVVENFMAILRGSHMDILLLQDGVGVGDPPLAFAHLYYEAFQRLWPDETAADSPSLPRLCIVIEAFEPVSGPDEPFVAIPASPARLQAQIETAARYFDSLVLFTFDDYLRPAPNQLE